MKLTQDHINQLCEKRVEGFGLSVNGEIIACEHIPVYNFKLKSSWTWEKIYYPLFLTRAIETVNKSMINHSQVPYIILIPMSCGGWYYKIEDEESPTFPTCDEAKEAAIIYYLKEIK